MNEWDDEYDEISSKKPPIDEVLHALQHPQGGVVPAVVFYGLSELSADDLVAFVRVWKQLGVEFRHKLLMAMIEASEMNFELDYDAIGFVAIRDSNPDIRRSGIELLWENETSQLMVKLIKLARGETDDSVRAEAVKALGRYILLGELGSFPEDQAQLAQACVLDILQDASNGAVVRRRALESIANCSHPSVPDAIHNAYHGNSEQMQIGSIFAMGRSCDNRWNPIIVRELSNTHTEMRFEAVRASGELEIEDAVPILATLLHDDNLEIQESAVWALGEIGGKEVIRILNAFMDEVEDSDNALLIEAIEDAIGNANLPSADLLMFDFDE